jgi:ADP-ribose pyrophosphatase
MPDIVTLFASRWLILQKIDHWEFVRRPHANAAVGILAITPENQIILVEQFRIPMQRVVIEIPAGLVGDEPDHAHESLAETARRELLEETGYLAHHIKPLLASPTSAGMSSEMTHLFLATNLEKIHEGGGTDHESITVHLVPLQDLPAWLAEQTRLGKLVDCKIHAALYQMSQISADQQHDFSSPTP